MEWTMQPIQECVCVQPGVNHVYYYYEGYYVYFYYV